MTGFDDTASTRASRDRASAQADAAGLLARAAAGDPKAFSILYDLYAPRMLGLLLKILRDRAEAEDALQGALLEVWRKAGAFDPAIGSPDTWILLIARARGIDALRKRTAAGRASAGLTATRA